MDLEIIPPGHGKNQLVRFAPGRQQNLPALIVAAGDRAADSFIEYFTATIRNANTRSAYFTAVRRFCTWCEDAGLQLAELRPVHVATYIESHSGSAPTRKQHLAAIRMLFDFLVIRQIVPMNPASSVRGPRYVISRGKTPVLEADDARKFLNSFDISTLTGLRNRALAAVMVFSFARVSAVVGMKVEDYYHNGRRSFLRFHEKGGKEHEVPAHHLVVEYLDEYLAAAGIAEQPKTPLFRSLVSRWNKITPRPMHRNDAFRMVKAQAKLAGVWDKISNHTFRATGITAFLNNGGVLEKAQQIAAHSSPRTTKLYDRTKDELTLDEIERIRL
jgi:integrase/recombinase XerD